MYDVYWLKWWWLLLYGIKKPGIHFQYHDNAQWQYYSGGGGLLMINSKCSVWHNTQYNRKNVHIQDWTVFLGFLLQGRWPGLIRDPTLYSKDILHKANGNHLDRVHSDQMVFEMIRQGMLVLFIGGQESQSQLKGDGQARVHSDQIFSWQSGGRLVFLNGGQINSYILWGCSNEIQKTTLDSQANLNNKPETA
jgi:hypothetical protein